MRYFSQGIQSWSDQLTNVTWRHVDKSNQKIDYEGEEKKLSVWNAVIEWLVVKY